MSQRVFLGNPSLTGEGQQVAQSCPLCLPKPPLNVQPLCCLSCWAKVLWGLGSYSFCFPLGLQGPDHRSCSINSCGEKKKNKRRWERPGWGRNLEREEGKDGNNTGFLGSSVWEEGCSGGKSKERNDVRTEQLVYNSSRLRHLNSF